MEFKSKIAQRGFRRGMPKELLLLPKHEQILKSIAERVKRRRIHLDMTQATLAQLSEVPLPTYRKFERTGFVSLQAFVKIGLALDAEEEFANLLNTLPKSTKKPSPKKEKATKQLG